MTWISQSAYRLQTPTTDSRDISPAPSHNTFSNSHQDVGTVSTGSLLEGLSTALAPPLSFPEPLPAPLVAPERQEPLPPLDIVGLNAPQRKALRQARKLHLKQLIPLNKQIASAAMKRLEVLLITRNPFPNRSESSMLASTANAWACIKYGKSLLIEVDSEYEDLVSKLVERLNNN